MSCTHGRLLGTPQWHRGVNHMMVGLLLIFSTDIHFWVLSDTPKKKNLRTLCMICCNNCHRFLLATHLKNHHRNFCQFSISILLQEQSLISIYVPSVEFLQETLQQQSTSDPFHKPMQEPPLKVIAYSNFWYVGLILTRASCVGELSKDPSWETSKKFTSNGSN